jgi:hypothetical protein
VDQNLHVLSPSGSPTDGVNDPLDGIREYVATMVETGTNPALVVLDTLASLTPGDENTVESTRPLWGFANAITKATGAAVLIIYHFGKPVLKPGSARSLLHAIRGSSAHVGSARFILALSLKKKGQARESGDEDGVWTPFGGQAARGDVLELGLIKNNDGPEGYSMLLERNPETGILAPFDPVAPEAVQEHPRPGSGKRTKMMTVLSIYTDASLDNDARRERALQVFKDTKDPEGSLRSYLRHLRAKGFQGQGVRMIGT